MLGAYRPRRTRLAACTLAAAFLATANHSPTLFAQDEDPWQESTAALELEVKTKKGVRYTGRVPRTAANEKLFAGEKAPDLTEVDESAKISIAGFNGLSGSISLKLGELQTLQVIGPLDKEALASEKDSRAAAKESKWAKERERLKKIDEARKARAQAELAAAAQTTGELPELSEPAAAWMESYPPEEGWVPAKKAQLYYQTVVLDNRPMTDEERNWLDNYDAWKLAYDEWLGLEQARFALEQGAGAGGGVPTDPGASASKATGSSSTANSSAASIDPEADGQGGAGLPKTQPVGAKPKAGAGGGDGKKGG